MPEVSKIPISPLSWYGKLKSRNVGGDTLLGLFDPISNRVEVNPGGEGEDFESTLVHELTHARQQQERGYLPSIWNTITGGGEPYNRRPDELEAIQAETDYKLGQGKPVQRIIEPAWNQPVDDRPWYQKLFSPADMRYRISEDKELRNARK
jgi:hypothetical protein